MKEHANNRWYYFFLDYYLYLFNETLKTFHTGLDSMQKGISPNWTWIFSPDSSLSSMALLPWLGFTAVGCTVNTMYSPGVVTGKKIYVSREEWQPVSVTVKAQTYQHYFDRNDDIILLHWRPEFSPICQGLTLVIKSFCVTVLLLTLICPSKHCLFGKVKHLTHKHSPECEARQIPRQCQMQHSLLIFQRNPFKHTQNSVMCCMTWRC